MLTRIRQVKKYIRLFYENIIDAVLDAKSSGTTIEGATNKGTFTEISGSDTATQKGETAKQNLVTAFEDSERPASNHSKSSADGISIINCFEAMVLRYYVKGLAPFFSGQKKVDTAGTERA